MSLERLRRSDRVSISIPVEVFGADFSGEHFVEQSRTVLVSRHGATVVMSRKLGPDLELILRRPGTKKEALVRVVGQIGGQHDGYIYGLALMDQNVNLWNIYFPALTEGQSAVGRALLQCGRCKNREIVYMDEVEAEVYEANLCLQRSCSQCGHSSIWKAVPGELMDEPLPPAEAAAGDAEQAAGEGTAASESAVEAPPEPPPPVVSRRKNLRIKSNMPACIRQPGFDEEVVTCEDVSRGGLCFKSGKRYFLGSRIEVAIPYAAGAANIFVPARIVYTQELTKEGAYKYGVSYLKK
ncbi:MAG TPA: PilZ domain-containing protein [Candidatus Binatia bacterium]|nr:PilZ domain-containing protein [Candidatus Binatia bacterium]